MMDSKILLACPFCGWGKPFIFDTGDDPFWVECPDCYAEGPTEDTADEAIKAWNTRAALKGCDALGGGE